MSIELANDTDLLGQFASNAGYSDLIRYAKDSARPDLSGPKDAGLVLTVFFRKGWTEEPADVIKAMEDVAASAPSDVADTAAAFLDLARGEEFLIISDGQVGADVEKFYQGGDLAKYSYGMTQVDIPKDSEVGKEMLLAQGCIAKEDLAGHGLESEFHVTVRYGVQGDDFSGIRAYIASQKPFSITFGEIASFAPTPQSDDAAPIIVFVSSLELERINTEIEAEGSFKESNFDYQPHATLAYVKPEATEKYVGGNFNGRVMLVTGITMYSKDDEPEFVSFGSARFPGLPELQQSYQNPNPGTVPKE